MALDAPLRLPDKMPPASRVTEMFHEMFEAEQDVLGGLRLKDLFGYTMDVTRIWLVGSRAWSLAVLGMQAESHKDFDFVFGYDGGAEDFIKASHEKIAQKFSTDIVIKRNAHDGWKVKHKEAPQKPPEVNLQPVRVQYDILQAQNDRMNFDFVDPALQQYGSGEGILDAWDLPEDYSIAEHICGFRWPHERVAILVGCCPGETGGVVRLVRPDSHIGQQSRNAEAARIRNAAESGLTL